MVSVQSSIILTALECSNFFPSVDEVFKSSSRISHVAAVNDYSKTPFQCAMQYNGSMWEFFEKYPGYLQRIQMAMVGFSHLQPHQQMISGKCSDINSPAFPSLIYL